MVHRILIAVDDGETASKTARVARALFDDDSTEILGVNVAARPVQWLAPGMGYGMVFSAFPVLDSSGDRTIDVELRTGARQQAEQVLDDAGIDDAVAIGALGDAVTAILTAAAEHQVDLIAVGGDDAGFLDRMFGRSVPRALLTDADRPVLVVPSTAREPDLGSR
jgi:nucleotide-binding universal stress UspA family protein